jgi:dolichol-phosphate mannosyltransferase
MVVVPTYEEAANIVDFLGRVRAEAPDSDVMVVDDASPDGTADLAEKAGAELGQVEVFRRPVKDGLGNAYRQAFAKALDAGYEILVTIDADGQHDPAVIPELVKCIEDGADVAVGSRYVPGGSTPNWPKHRQALSRYGNRYAGWVLGLRMRDATSGLRAYRADLLREIHYDTSTANGYAFMTELAYRISTARATVAEVPITFTDRQRGTSKMSATIIVESMSRVTWWGLTVRLKRWREAKRSR